MGGEKAMSAHNTHEKQFLTYMNRLRDDLNVAYSHYEIAKLLREFRQTRYSEYSEAITFFRVTQDANLFAAVMAICRFIDERTDTMQLHSFFELVRKNLDLFTTSIYRTRLVQAGMDEEDIEHWTRLHLEVTKEMMDADEAKVKNMPVKNLLIWRHKKLAHLDKELALNEIDLIQENPVTVKEIDDIFTTLDEILNKYGTAYDGKQWIIGLPPVKQEMENIMDSIKFHREHWGIT
jgi:hypothetical protein